MRHNDIPYHAGLKANIPYQDDDMYAHIAWTFYKRPAQNIMQKTQPILYEICINDF